MKSTLHIRVACFGGLLLGCVCPAMAHRTDEYLQATKLMVERDRIHIEMSLTPGIDIAPLVFSWMDTDQDGRISGAEGTNYANEVIQSLDLQVDGTAVSIVPNGQEFPAFAEMREGIGIVRLRATARLPYLEEGIHRIVYRNGHRPEWSIYLSNPLVPQDPGVKILTQNRDRLQRELAVEYRLPASRPLWGAPALTVGAFLTLISCVVLVFRLPVRSGEKPGPDAD